MSQMNRSRILFGGLLGGMVINTGEYLLHGVVFQEDWKNLTRKFGDAAAPQPVQWAVLTVAGFLMGILTVWLYASIRPGFASASRAVLSVAAALWMPGYFLGLTSAHVFGVLPGGPMLLFMVAGFVELALAASLGRLIHADARRPAPAPAPAAAS